MIDMASLDKQCNALFRKLDEMKAAGQSETAEYLQVLLTLRDKTRQRLGR